MNNLNVDPSTLTLAEKMQLFERATEGRGIPRPVMSAQNIFPSQNARSKRPETSNSDNNPSSNELSQMMTSTPHATSSKSNTFGFWNSLQKKITKKPSANLPRHQSVESLHPTSSKHDNSMHNWQLHKPVSTPDQKLEMQKVFHDLDNFIETELNEIQSRKRIGQLEKSEKIKELVKDGDDKIYATIRMLKDEVREIKNSQKEFENKINKKEHMKRLEYETSSIESTTSGSKKKKQPAPSQVQYTSVEVHPMPPPPAPPMKSKPKETNENQAIKDLEVPLSYGTSNTSLVSEHSREERIARLESELFKAETLMIKINRVLEGVSKVDEDKIDSIINIERHYLVASTRFQTILTELRKINENIEDQHLSPYNRKGMLVIRDIMLEVKSAYFQRKIPSRNEFLLVMIKYNDKVMASNAIRITDDVRIVKFPERFSIPEAHADFEMRLEIYGTAFWRKTKNVRETMLKKYGFVTFTLADTGTKPKRFQMIEVMQAENVPIRSKILMRITQKITARVQYRGLLFVKVREVWYETSTQLNGHILEISFKSYSFNRLSQSRETIVLDLYNYDTDAVIPVDTRISKRPFSFSLKFNHYVDVANFYLMAAADSAESYAEWVSAINKVLVLIK